MRIALSALSLPDLGLSEVAQTARDAGFDALELFRHRTEANVAHPELSVRTIHEQLSAAGIELAACEIRPLTGRKADSNERNLPYNLRQLEWDVHLCRALGVRTVGLRGGADDDDARRDLVQGINELAERVDDVVFAVGTAAGSCLSTLADLNTILPELSERAGLLLDTQDLLGVGIDPVSVVRSWGHRIRLVHLHTPEPATEVLDVDSLMLGLRQAGYCGVIAVQTAPEHLAAARQRLAS